MNNKEQYNQAQYNKTWTEKNKEYSNYLKSRSSARSFIKNKSKKEDLLELIEMINTRMIELNQEVL